ncbi:hypothetical protein ILYODFUR_020767 [Ilyodon furcidens]|uniref:Uncharacterized protein n=1 Tax=Ilyodon furcidens TaxID=33524 RepID=A0ABV0SNM7_9TELE
MDSGLQATLFKLLLLCQKWHMGLNQLFVMATSTLTSCHFDTKQIIKVPEMLLQYFYIMFLPHPAIYSVGCTSPSCHPHTLQLGRCFQACELPPFPSKCNNGQNGPFFYFSFIRVQVRLPNMMVFCS